MQTNDAKRYVSIMVDGMINVQQVVAVTVAIVCVTLESLQHETAQGTSSGEFWCGCAVK